MLSKHNNTNYKTYTLITWIKRWQHQSKASTLINWKQKPFK